MNRGLFISFEGNEGAGKSTQVQLLVNKLREMGHNVVATREPGGTRIGEQIRSITHNTENVDLTPIAEAYLMAAARAQHVAGFIEPSLEAGKLVVCDRFVDSSIAYQGYGRNLGPDKIKELNALAVNGAAPDITFLLNVTQEEGLKRRHGDSKGLDRLDMQQKDFYSRVSEGYLAVARENAQRYIVIDASKSIEEVATAIWTALEPRLTKAS